MQELILEYKQSLKLLKTAQPIDEMEEKVINEMISDIQFAIDWMKQGKRPNHYSKSIETKTAYSRRTLLDMDLFPCMEILPEVELSQAKKIAVMKVLRVLTERQLTCFLLHAAHMRSMQEIANELNLKKTTVQEHIETARKKIKEIAKEIAVS